ncbi:hypothetical protein N9D31_00900 [Oligoflexaceae bacterium]|nr:hypothetical protein [Oligoflexaceae bacterium]
MKTLSILQRIAFTCTYLTLPFQANAETDLSRVQDCKWQRELGVEWNDGMPIACFYRALKIANESKDGKQQMAIAEYTSRKFSTGYAIRIYLLAVKQDKIFCKEGRLEGSILPALRVETPKSVPAAALEIVKACWPEHRTLLKSSFATESYAPLQKNICNALEASKDLKGLMKKKCKK